MKYFIPLNFHLLLKPKKKTFTQDTPSQKLYNNNASNFTHHHFPNIGQNMEPGIRRTFQLIWMDYGAKTRICIKPCLTKKRRSA